MAAIGIRLEDKNIWERRAPLTPEHVKKIVEEYGIDVYVESSDIRAFSDREYEEAGATVVENLDDVPIIFGVKEMPPYYFKKGKTFIFFSHTIKGQEENMHMLQKLLDNNCQLIDYERIADEAEIRLVFFGHYAGYAGMMDSLWALGRRYESEGIDTPFADLHTMVEYDGLDDAEEALEKVAEKIKNGGIPDEVKPIVIGFAGYGHVSQTAQKLVDDLPSEEVSPDEIYDLDKEKDVIYKVVFKEKDMVEPNSPNWDFELQDYYDNPARYHSIFSRYLPYLTVLMNCIYWDKKYPRFVKRENLRQLYVNEEMKLKVVGDISCDMEGGIEFNTHATNPGDPVYLYEPLTEETRDGYEGEGVVVLAVDNLPCELPRESTEEFSNLLLPFVKDIAEADYTKPFEELDLPPEIKKAVIVYNGELTPDYEYIEEYLEGEKDE